MKPEPVGGPAANDSAQEHASILLRDCSSLLEEADVGVESTIVRSDHVAGAITDETASHDLTILGATRDPSLKRTLVGSVAEGVGRAAASPGILTRRTPQPLNN